MRRLDELRQIADQSLAGLTATDDLRRRIRAKAAEKRPVWQKRTLVPALSFAAALAVCFFAVRGILPGNGTAQPTTDPKISSYTLGSDSTEEGYYSSDLGRESVTIKRDRNGVPSLQNLWAKETNGIPPMIVYDGRYYRMLSEPSSASGDVLGSSVGSISEFTLQPELSDSHQLKSNVAQAGTEVYLVNGMGKTLLAANVTGSIRVFQRVSYNNASVLSGESLADTLQISGHITAMALSGVGTVDQSASAESLFSKLVSSASFKSSGSVTANQTLIITLDNGLAVQLSVKGDYLGACGVWSCPEFFDAFNAALQ